MNSFFDELEFNQLGGSTDAMNALNLMKSKLDHNPEFRDIFILLTDGMLSLDKEWVIKMMKEEGIKFLIIFIGKSTPSDIRSWCQKNGLLSCSGIKVSDYQNLDRFIDCLEGIVTKPPDARVTRIGYDEIQILFPTSSPENLPGAVYQVSFVKKRTLNKKPEILSSAHSTISIKNLEPDTEYILRYRLKTSFGSFSEWTPDEVKKTEISILIVFNLHNF